MPVLRAKGLDVAGPLRPLSPEFPDVATGVELADETALPVVPELVALDWDAVAPESPDEAKGLALRAAAPPGPPAALPEAMDEPPMDTPFTELLPAEPPEPAEPLTVPPAPPAPPNTLAEMMLRAGPVAPEV